MNLRVEQTYEGKDVRNWRVTTSPAGSAAVTVRESALYPRVYCCLTCRVNECPHVAAVRAFDSGAVPA